jgi:Ca2+-binding EF-hand superfamily protein
MGCCSEKMNAVKNKFHQLALSEEETVITMKEKSLPFSSVRLQDLSDAILINSSNGMLSIAQLRKAMTELNIEVEIFTSPEEHIQCLLKLLQNSKRLYDVKTVIMFGVLLSAGISEEKAGILFDLCNTNNNHYIQEGDFKDMLSELIDISVVKIPRIAISSNAEAEGFTIPEDRLLQYTSCLQKNKAPMISRVTSVLFAERKTMQKEEFVNRISNDSFLETILWSFQIRLALID